MKLKLLFSMLALSFASFLYATDPTGIVAISADGSETSFILADVERIKVSANYSQGFMSICDKDGNQVGKYQKVLFSSISTSIGETVIPNVYVYPNPVVNTLNVQGATEDTSLSVYNLAGQCLLNEYGSEINVASLQQGTYILCVDKQYVKFIKK